MSVYEEYNVDRKRISTSLDCVVIRQYLGGITGGKALDYSSFKDDVIKAGHIIVKETVLGEDVYSPLAVSDGQYVDVGTKKYVGVVVSSKPKGEAVAIMDNGRVNDVAMPYPITEAMRTALKTALPNLIFEHD